MEKRRKKRTPAVARRPRRSRSRGPASKQKKTIARVARELDEALARQTATSDILHVISGSPDDLQPVFSSIARTAMQLCNGSLSVVTRYDGEFLDVVAHAHVAPEGLGLLRSLFPMRPTAGTINGRAIVEAAVVDIEDTHQDPEYPRPFAERLNMRSAIAVPILRDRQPIGTIAVGWFAPRAYTSKEIALLQTFADQAVIAIESVRLFDEIKEKNRELARDREALSRQHQADRRHLEWLQRLAGFLRHEVRQPIAQITSSIELIQLASYEDDRLKPYISSATKAAQDVWNLVERVSRATDVETFVRQGAPQRLDVANLLGDMVEGCRRTYSGIGFDFDRFDACHVNADPMLITEALGNLLVNAASFAHEESTVSVHLNETGGQAVIRVANQGPLIDGEPEALFEPFASTRSGPASEHQGLGLYLVRLVAEHHGGRATIANLADKSGVEAQIILPLQP